MTQETVKQFIDSLPKWDGKDHIRALAKTLGGDKFRMDSNQIELIYWLSGVIIKSLNARAYQKCLLLVGPQNIGKTTWLRRLYAPMKHLTHEGPLNLQSEETKQLLREKMIINIDSQLETIDDRIEIQKIIREKFYPGSIGLPASDFNSASFVASNTKYDEHDSMSRYFSRDYVVLFIDKIDLSEKIDYTQVWAQVITLAKLSA